MKISGIELVTVDVTRMPSGGKFYPSDINVWVTPITDEESECWKGSKAYDIDTSRQKIYELMVNHVFVSSLSNGMMSLNDILWVDYLWMILYLRETSGFNTLSVCVEGTLMPLSLTTENLVAMTDSSKLMERYNEEGRCFDFNCGNAKISMYMPTIGSAVSASNMLSKMGNDKNVSSNHMLQNVIKCVPFLIGDWRFLSTMSDDEVYVYSMNFMNYISTFDMETWRDLLQLRDDMTMASNSLRINTVNGHKRFLYNFNFGGLFTK